MSRNRIHCFVASIAFAISAATALAGFQGAVAAPAPKKQSSHAHSHIFACPKCDMASMKGGKCPGCGKTMMEIHAHEGYGCTKCNTFAGKPGNCPKCKAKMSKAVMTYGCEMCKVSSEKAGKCPKCGMTLKKYVMTMAKK